MFERLKEKRVSPYLLGYFAFCCISFFVFSFLYICYLYLLSDMILQHKSFWFVFWVGVFFLHLLYGFFIDSVALRHLIDIKKEETVCLRDIHFQDLGEEVCADYYNCYINSVYVKFSLSDKQKPTVRLIFSYIPEHENLQDKKNYFRFVATEDKMSLISAWTNIDPDFEKYPYEYVVYRRSRVLKEVRLREDYDYPVEIREIVDVFNKMYP